MPCWREWGAVHMPCWMQTSTTRWLCVCLSSFNNSRLWLHTATYVSRKCFMILMPGFDVVLETLSDFRLRLLWPTLESIRTANMQQRQNKFCLFRILKVLHFSIQSTLIRIILYRKCQETFLKWTELPQVRIPTTVKVF